MKKFPRVLSLVLALALSLSLCVPAFAAGGGFSDVPSSYWAYDDIMACAQQGSVSGFDDGTFRPESPVTRIQFIVMIVRTFYPDQLSAVSTPAGQSWTYPYIKVASDNEITKYLDTIDNGAMTRYEMAIAAKNTCIKNGTKVVDSKLKEAQEKLKEWDSMPGEGRVAARYCYALGVLSGMGDGSFHGEQTMTRAQACAVINRMIVAINGLAYYHKLANGKDITLENVQEILDEIRQEYPDGTLWTNRSVNPNTEYYSLGNWSTDVKNIYAPFKGIVNGVVGPLGTEYACSGWGALVSDRIFGQTGYPGREVTDPSKVRPGDIILIFNVKGQVEHVCVAIESAYEETRTTLSGVEYTSWYFHTCGGNEGDVVIWGIDDPVNGIYHSACSIDRSRYREGDNYARAWTRYPD